MEKILVTIDEASELISLGENSIRNLIKAQALNTINVGTKKLIPVKELERFANDYVGLEIGTIEEIFLAKQEVERNKK